jgi:hypothetical protein
LELLVVNISMPIDRFLLHQSNKITAWPKRKRFFVVSSWYQCDEKATHLKLFAMLAEDLLNGQAAALTVS